MKNPIPQYHDNISLQVAAMRSLYPYFQFFNNNGQRYWIGTLQPTEYSDSYLVRVNYREGLSPKGFVVAPKLKENAPHLYSSDGSLCLFFPQEKRWQSNWLIAQYFIPWICEYLYFYECWLESGIWYGDEAPHGDTKK